MFIVMEITLGHKYRWHATNLYVINKSKKCVSACVKDRLL